MRKISIKIYLLLVTVVLVTSTISIAADIEKQMKNFNYVTKEFNPIIRGPIVWDNGMEFSDLMYAQWDESKQFDFYIVDDFIFEEDTEVSDVNWRGGYWGEGYQSGDFNWCISFFYDNSTSNKPEGFPKNPSFAGPYCFTWNEIEKVILNDTGTSIYFEFYVDLQETLLFESGNKYWISIWAEGSFPPQSGWCYHKSYLLNASLLGSKYFGFPFWTPGHDVQGFDFDMAFKLTAPLEPLPPTPPFIDGPREGSAKTRLCWTFQSEDPNEDEIKYIISWGDETMNETEYNQSDIPIESCHFYTRKKVFVIIAYAEDETGLRSNESTFAVTIPRFNAINNNIIKIFFERFSNNFFFFRQLFSN